ncbi:unnamed protein product [Leptidea sinapis]|uniref:Kinesin motor domain-containing protein n=1 Tax=Leptidea sinapis TaxID=189913 RepID=A0A5E4R5V1_9NEOP|nr:unnamed protein product [Leptidea sinapis]
MPDAELGGTVENVRVMVRVRPLDQKEKIGGAYNCVSVDGVNNTVAVTRSNVSPPEPPRIYAYDAVFDSNTSQVIFCTNTSGYGLLVKRHSRYLTYNEICIRPRGKHNFHIIYLILPQFFSINCYHFN